jgi:hypothetical protein
MTMSGRQSPRGANRDFSGFPADNLAARRPVIPNECQDPHGAGVVPMPSPISRRRTIGWVDKPGVYARRAKTHESTLVLATGEGNPTVGQDVATGLALTGVITVVVGAAHSSRNIFGADRRSRPVRAVRDHDAQRVGRSTRRHGPGRCRFRDGSADTGLAAFAGHLVYAS